MENKYEGWTQEELEKEASKILDNMTEEEKKKIKIAFINLLLFGEAKYEIRN